MTSKITCEKFWSTRRILFLWGFLRMSG